jgi:hypothetical protein
VTIMNRPRHPSDVDVTSTGQSPLSSGRGYSAQNSVAEP